ncbi:unnamed protein product [Psylliodes chrysocephalus]|uniref:C2H2-type domain-containing protein n=1 Tax=Psylliodes chrysocephalus TaxID=3402493 RepID=A0A9P0CX52_9CUCU|nr:unnamed protein product [Psylliodes chrysocephala]
MARKRRMAKSKKLKKTSNNIFKHKNTFLNVNNNEINHPPVALKHDTRGDIEVKESLVTPNGKTFYPCQYCTKIFPREATCKTHIEKCSSRSNPVAQNNINSKSKANNIESLVLNTSNDCRSCENGDISNGSDDDSEKSINKSEMLNISGSSTEKKHLPSTKGLHRINISQNIMVKSATTVIQDSTAEEKEADDDDDVQIIPQEIPKYDLSIYDYDEDTTDETPQIKEHQCKLCPFVAENAIDLIRHKRKEHSGPRKIISPDEIQKYFDWPDRDFCPICEKPIKTKNYKSLFIKHLLVHTTGLAYECKICKKKFRRIDHLKGHEKRHIITFDELQAIQNTVYEDDIALKQHINMS